MTNVLPLHFELKKKPCISVTAGGVLHHFYMIPLDRLTAGRMKAYTDGMMLLECGLTPMQLDIALNDMLHENTDKQVSDADYRRKVNSWLIHLKSRKEMLQNDTLVSAMSVFLVGENESVESWNIETAHRNASILYSDTEAVFFCAKKVLKHYKGLAQLSDTQVREFLTSETLLSTKRLIL